MAKMREGEDSMADEQWQPFPFYQSEKDDEE
jgi:hypothetical protein